MAEIVTETEVQLRKKQHKGTTTIRTIEIEKETLGCDLVKYARRPYIQTYLGVQNSKDTYQASQMAQTASLKKYANSA